MIKQKRGKRQCLSNKQDLRISYILISGDDGKAEKKSLIRNNPFL